MDAGISEWIIEHAADAMVCCDGAGTILRWNAAAVALFGFSREEALGASLDLIIPEHLRQAHWEGFRRALASGSTRLSGRPTLTRALAKDSGRLYVQMSFALVRDPAGSVVGSVAIARRAERGAGD